MKKAFLLLASGAAAVTFYACNKGMDNSSGGEAYLDLPSTTYKYYNVSSGPDSPNAQATLGRVLFYDRHLSINNSISCGSCHKQAFAFADNAAKSLGFESKMTGRNTPPLQNFSASGVLLGGTGFGTGSLFWDGRENDMEKLITRPISNHVEMGIDDLNSLPAKIAALPYYSQLFQQAYGSSDVTLERMSKAVAMFINAIKAVNTRFDQRQQGLASFTALELEGEQLFKRKYNCANCHNEQIGGYFSGDFRDIGLDATYSDQGLGTITGRPSDRGKFKVPNLRNVALTAPYMHDGRFKTLDDVLEHYSHNIQPSANLDTQFKMTAAKTPMRMNISAHEKEAIIAFLGTLTDGDLITNPAYSDPFKTK